MVRIGAGKLFELDELELRQGDVLALGLGHPLHLEAEGNVAERGAPRKKLGEILKHDAAVHAVAGHGLAADADFAVGGVEKAGDDVEQRGLAAARRSHQAKKLGRFHVEAHARDARHGACGRIVGERDVADFDVGHSERLKFHAHNATSATLVEQRRAAREIETANRSEQHEAGGLLHRLRSEMASAIHFLSGYLLTKPSRFGIRTFGSVSLFITSFSPMTLLSASM